MSFLKFVFCLGLLIGGLSTAAAQAMTASSAPQVESAFRPETDTISRKYFNFKLHPLPFIIGLPKVSLNWIIGRKVGIGVEGAYLILDNHFRRALRDASDSLAADDYKIGASMIGSRIDIALNDSLYENTFYLAPKYSSVTVEIADNISDSKSKANVDIVALVIGYQWMWDNFNIQLGAGAAKAVTEDYDFNDASPIDQEDIERSVQPGIDFEFSLGLAF